MRWIGRIVGALVILVIAGIGFLHTSWGKSMVRGIVESKLGDKVNGKVSLGGLDYTFLFGSLDLTDIDIEDATGKRAIHVDSIHAAIDRGSILDGTPIVDDLAVSGVAVDLVQHADGTTNLTGLFKPSDAKPLERLQIAKLAVSGQATITKPDGSIVKVTDLAVAGTIDARPAAKEVKAEIDRIAAHVAIIAPDAPERDLGVAIDKISVDKRVDSVDAAIGSLAIGALTVEALKAHAGLAADGHLEGSQSVTIGKARVDSKELAKLAGREVLLDDLVIAASITGPADKLAITGSIATRETSVSLLGTADVSNPARPKYNLTISGKGKSGDVVAADKNKRPVATSFKVTLNGEGIAPSDIDTDVGLEIGPTTIGGLPNGSITVDTLVALAHAKHGVYQLEKLGATGLGFEISATGELVAADKHVTARVVVGGSPAEAIRVLGAAGLAIPRKVPILKRIDIAVSAEGHIGAEMNVTVEPMTLAIAGGTIGVGGTAHLDQGKLVGAETKIDLKGLDIASLAALAGKPPPKVRGAISGSLDIVKTATGQRANGSVGIALYEPALSVQAGVAVTETSARVDAGIYRRGDRVKVGNVSANLTLDPKGVVLDGPWRLVLDVPVKSFDDVMALLPAAKKAEIAAKIADKLPDGLPVGNAHIHADLAGTPIAPRGKVTVTASVDALKDYGTQVVELVANLAPTAKGMKIAIHADAKLDAGTTIASIDATATTPRFFTGTVPTDPQVLRAGTSFEANVTLPPHDLALFAPLRAKLAEFGGSVDGSIHAEGTPAAPVVAANLKWTGYAMANGTTGETTITAKGNASGGTFAIDYNHQLAITGDVDRADPMHPKVVAHISVPETAPLALLPGFVHFDQAKLEGADVGKLTWNMDIAAGIAMPAAGTEDKPKLDTLAVTGGLELKGSSIVIPHTTRKIHDVALAIEGAGDRIVLKTLSAHESDIEKQDRNLDISGELALDHGKPASAKLELRAKDFLVFGGTLFGLPDAPRATATFDISVAADISKPVKDITATIHGLELYSPDRQERAHQPEAASVTGDVVFVDAEHPVGKLVATPNTELPPKPNAPPPPEVVKPRPALDIHVRIPKDIHLVQTPFDLFAHGDLDITVRDEGVRTRGALAMTHGGLALFGRDHELVEGKLSFTDEHPKGWLELTFDRRIPDASMRDLATASGAARITFAGPPTKPKPSLGGAAGAAMFEVMSMYNAGRPVNVSRPGLPASSTVQMPRGDQLFVLTFMATNLPHLLFLDRIQAWADATEPTGGYGQIRDMEAERYSKNEGARVRAVVRPPQPGRSNAELQLDRVFVHHDRGVFGVGLRAGDRVGGGAAIFVEWSSE